MWEYDLAKAIKKTPANEFDRVWYKAVYSGGSWLLMGGQLRFSGASVRYTLQAKDRTLADGLEAWVLFDHKQNGILVLDVIG